MNDEEKLKKLLDLMDDPTGTLLTDIEALQDKTNKNEKDISSLASKYSVTEDEIRALFNALESGQLKGEKGENYILTDGDKKEIATAIHVPVIEKIIEKTEIIHEQPIVTEITKITNEIKEVAVPDTADDIRNKLELLLGEERLDAKAIKNLPKGKNYDNEISQLKENVIRATSLPPTTSFVNGKRAKNIDFVGATVEHAGDKATVTISTPDLSTTYLNEASNLSDLANVATARTNLGISGTQNTVPKFGASSSLGNSLMSDDGTSMSVLTTASGAKLQVSGTSGGSTFGGGTISSLGSSTEASGNQAFAAGAHINPLAIDTLVAGYKAYASGGAGFGSQVILGARAYSSGNNSVVVGGSSYAVGGQSTVLGVTSSSLIAYGIVIGYNQQVNAASSGVIGAFSGVTHRGSWSIGWGNASERVAELIFGNRDSAGEASALRLTGCTTLFTGRNMFRLQNSWIDSTDATRKARNIFYVYDTAEREFLRANSNGTANPDLLTNGLLKLVAGSTTLLPLQFQSGALLTTALAGGIEFLTDDFYGTITTSAARKKFVLDDGTALTSGRVPFATTNGRLTDSSNFVWDNTNFRLGIGTTPSATLDVSGSMRTATVEKSANYTLTITDSTIYATTGVGGITTTLPAASATTVGLYYFIYKVDSGVGLLTIAAAGTDTINGAATKTIANQWNGVLIRGLTSTSWLATSFTGL